MKHTGWVTAKMSRRLILSELRRQGFKRTFRQRHQACSEGVCQYEKQIGPRIFNVQLWDGGLHRVSYMHNGRCTTAPTDFTTVTGMKKAIEFQTHRPEDAL